MMFWKPQGLAWGARRCPRWWGFAVATLWCFASVGSAWETLAPPPQEPRPVFGRWDSTPPFYLTGESWRQGSAKHHTAPRVSLQVPVMSCDGLCLPHTPIQCLQTHFSARPTKALSQIPVIFPWAAPTGQCCRNVGSLSVPLAAVCLQACSSCFREGRGGARAQYGLEGPTTHQSTGMGPGLRSELCACGSPLYLCSSHACSPSDLLYPPLQVFLGSQ